jgi:DNA-binding FadR family transcriptional regulator
MPDPIENLFSPSPPARAGDAVVEQVEKAVCDGMLAPGDRLPAERRLQQLLGISRNTLREALRVLEQKGLVEIRKGHKGGTFVKRVTADPLSANLATYIRSNGVSLEEIAQFRADLEGLLADRAARTITAQDRRELKRLLAELASRCAAGTEGWETFIVADRAIHMALARMAGNPIHCILLETVHDNLHRHNVDRYLEKDTAYLQECHTEMTALVTAVCSGRHTIARERARDHVMQALARMQAGKATP